MPQESPERKTEESPKSLADIAFLIPCGGKATRLGSVAEETPKALLDIAGEPFIAHQLRLLKREGATQAIILLGHLGKQIRDFVGNGKNFDITVRYSDEGTLALGTGGAVRKAVLEYDNLPDEIAIIYGDTFLDISMDGPYARFKQSGLAGLMTIVEAKESDVSVWSQRNVEFNPSTGKIDRYDKTTKTPTMEFIDFGLSFFKTSAIRAFANSARAKFDLSDMFHSLIQQKQLAGYEVAQRYYDLNTPEALEETRNYLSQTQSRQKDH